MKIAIIETGGKQYIVSSGKKITVEKLPYEAGKRFEFDKVLMVADSDGTDGSGGELGIGKPYYNAKVFAELISQIRQPKVIIRKYHSKTRYRKKKGHRQQVSVVEILEIK